MAAKRAKSNATPLDEDCAICFGEILLKCTLACKHKFCYDCSKKWVIQNGKCPMCRGEVDLSILNEPQQINLKMGLPKSRKRAHDGQAEEDDDMEDVKPDVEQLKVLMANNKFVTTNATIFWIYETRTGGAWWRYGLCDEQVLEEAFKAKRDQIELDILGKMYTINLTEMTQCQQQYPDTMRNIKRVEEEEYEQLTIIGIAGCVSKDPKEAWVVE